MSEIKVDIDPKAIEDHIRTIGDKWDRNNPLRLALEKEVAKIVVQIVETDYVPKIRELVREKTSDKIVNDVFHATWAAFDVKINRSTLWSAW